jgi:hypothetical protein
VSTGGKKPQVPPLRSCGAPVGMTKIGNYFPEEWRLGWTELRAANPRRLQIPLLRSCGAPVGMTRIGNYFPEEWRLGWTELRAANPRRLQIPPLRSCGVPVGMTRIGQLLSGRVATWMDGVEGGYSAKTADPAVYAQSGIISLRTNRSRSNTVLPLRERPSPFREPYQK